MHYGRGTGKKIPYIQVVKNPQDLDTTVIQIRLFEIRPV